MLAALGALIELAAILVKEQWIRKLVGSVRPVDGRQIQLFDLNLNTKTLTAVRRG